MQLQTQYNGTKHASTIVTRASIPRAIGTRQQRQGWRTRKVAHGLGLCDGAPERAGSVSSEWEEETKEAADFGFLSLGDFFSTRVWEEHINRVHSILFVAWEKQVGREGMRRPHVLPSVTHGPATATSFTTHTHGLPSAFRGQTRNRTRVARYAPVCRACHRLVECPSGSCVWHAIVFVPSVTWYLALGLKSPMVISNDGQVFATELALLNASETKTKGEI